MYPSSDVSTLHCDKLNGGVKPRVPRLKAKIGPPTIVFGAYNVGVIGPYNGPLVNT